MVFTFVLEWEDPETHEVKWVQTKLVKNPTWMTCMEYFSQQIEKFQGEVDHVYLEGIDIVGMTFGNNTAYPVISFQTGS